MIRPGDRLEVVAEYRLYVNGEPTKTSSRSRGYVERLKQGIECVLRRRLADGVTEREIHVCDVPLREPQEEKAPAAPKKPHREYIERHCENPDCDNPRFWTDRAHLDKRWCPDCSPKMRQREYRERQRDATSG